MKTRSAAAPAILLTTVGVQRVLVDGAIVGEIGAGLCVLLGVAESDDEQATE